MKLLMTLFTLSFTLLAVGQSMDLTKQKPDKEFENIHVQRLAGDSLATSFLIWIKKEVPLHYHADHSEHVLMVDGTGILILNGKEIEMNPGMWVFIPKGSQHSFKTTSRSPAMVLSIQAPEFVGKDRVKVD